MLCIFRAALGALVVIALGLLLAEGQPAGKKAPKTKRIDTAEDLFTRTQIVRIQIELAEQGMRTLRDYQWGGWNGPDQKRPTVNCTVREGETVYKDVAVHLKGAAGSFRPVDDQPSLTLNFGKNVKGQNFHGIQRLSLNNSVQDTSLLNERICRELFAAAGIPAPRATHAKVQLNGRDLGVYVVTEAFNKQFLARHFKNPNGNLYDGGFVKDVRDPLEKSSGPNPNDRSDLLALADAAAERDPGKRLERLGKLLDLDQFITYVALDVMMCNWDGYAMNRNNYRIYHDPDSDKIVFMPHGMDQMFGVMRVNTDMPIFPQMRGLVAHAVLQTSEGKTRYRERMAQLMTNLFHADAITNRVWEMEMQLKPVLQEKDPRRARFQEREAVNFCRRIVAREANLKERLATPDDSFKFDPAGSAFLTNWHARVDSGKPLVDEILKDGKKLLHVSAGNGSAVGIWSTRIKLDPGRYRLQARARVQGVTPDAGDRRGGAGLRANVGGRRLNFTQKLTGDADWTGVTFDFEVQDSQPDMGMMGGIQEASPMTELICELRAAKGEAWFDRDSMVLTRRPSP